jgi:hypothetical protein
MNSSTPWKSAYVVKMPLQRARYGQGAQAGGWNLSLRLSAYLSQGVESWSPSAATVRVDSPSWWIWWARSGITQKGRLPTLMSKPGSSRSKRASISRK